MKLFSSRENSILYLIHSFDYKELEEGNEGSKEEYKGFEGETRDLK